MSQAKVFAGLPGRVCAISTTIGGAVAEDDPVVMIESMKMEIPITAPADGTVTEILVEIDDTVEEGQPVAVLEV